MIRSSSSKALEAPVGPRLLPPSYRGPEPVLASAAIPPQNLARVLTEVAAIASETLELQEVFDRVATSVRELIPFDDMGVLRILEGEWAVKHAATFQCKDADAHCSGPAPLSIWSPRMRPRPGPIERIDDAEAELDPSFPGDREILTAGVRSTLWEPFRSGGTLTGGVWLSARTKRAFNDEHQRALRPIAAILGSAVEHWRIWDAERRRRERLDKIESLVGALSASLDVREVFERISEGILPVLDHDMMVLSELDIRARTIRIIAHAGRSGIDPPTKTVSLTDEEMQQRSRDYEIMRDIPAEMVPKSERERLLACSGLRSWLRVPVRLSDEVRGSLGFFHREPSRYGQDDVEVASRLADRVALMLSHHMLAEEARIAAEARERAERLAATVETLTREMERMGRGRVVGLSRSWKHALEQVGRVAPSETTVLVTGESGTGKEVLAHLIHEGSPRAGKPFVAINCAALPENLLESELFGHERGAFTGAITAKVGRLEQAAGGTLFLDEISEMTPLVQAKFLRVLQEREFQRLGGTRTFHADVRVIAATNRDLAAAMALQQFREDLYYRLNVFQIHIPPLRERTDDILPMAEVFLEDLGRTMGRPAAGISRDARAWLLDYSWPGNVRELRNAVERAILLCDGGLITRDHLPAAMLRAGAPAPILNVAAATNPGAPIPDGGFALERVERGYVERAMEQAKGNKSKAARMLGLSRAQLYSRLEKYGIS